MELHVGGKFRISEKLGSGAFGEIYLGTLFHTTRLGTNMKTGEDVAIKLVMCSEKYRNQ